jgi:hypothetical protein
MEIAGKFLQSLEKITGEGKNGPWEKQEFIIETEEQYPKKVCIANWNNKVTLDNLNPGNQIKVSVNIESREYNSRWYTDVRAWNLEKIDSEKGVEAQPDFDVPPGDYKKPLEDSEAPPIDDLPF